MKPQTAHAPSDRPSAQPDRWCRTTAILHRQLILFALVWYTICVTAPPSAGQPPTTGDVHVSSTPSDAQIILNGTDTGLRTPAVLRDLPTGPHTLELSIPEYLFARRHIEVLADTMLRASFELISEVDTALVVGQLNLGLLVLPRPPITTPYWVDGRPVIGLEIPLNEGKHRVLWEGGNRYTTLDTIVDVFAGRATTFSFQPTRRSGTLTVQPYPNDAEVIINGTPTGIGLQSIVAPTGDYSIDARRKGYFSSTATIELLPDREAYVVVELVPIGDRDEDGFLDSVDRCPQRYGLYAGCPRPPHGEAWRSAIQSVLNSIRKDPLTFSVANIGILHRTPLNNTFRRFIKRFVDGDNYFNNKSGFTAAGSYVVSYRGLVLSLDLGQWNSSLAYRGTDTLTVGRDTDDPYLLIYDSLDVGSQPRITLPSTAVSVGIHLSMNRFTFEYTLGYQWEDIIIQGIRKPGDTCGTIVRFDNDGFISRLGVEADLSDSRPVSPTAYGSLSFCTGRNQPTGWVTVRLGIMLKIRPALFSQEEAPSVFRSTH